jgi:hypothetical protein
VFGNLCPHIHCHVLQQTFAHDPHQPLNLNADVVLLAADEYRELIGELQVALGRSLSRRRRLVSD